MSNLVQEQHAGPVLESFFKGFMHKTKPTYPFKKNSPKWTSWQSIHWKQSFFIGSKLFIEAMNQTQQKSRNTGRIWGRSEIDRLSDKIQDFSHKKQFNVSQSLRKTFGSLVFARMNLKINHQIVDIQHDQIKITWSFLIIYGSKSYFWNTSCDFFQNPTIFSFNVW